MKKIPDVERQPRWLCGDSLSFQQLLRPEMHCLCQCHSWPMLHEQMVCRQQSQRRGRWRWGASPAPYGQDAALRRRPHPRSGPAAGTRGHSLDIVWLWPCEQLSVVLLLAMGSGTPGHPTEQPPQYWATCAQVRKGCWEVIWTMAWPWVCKHGVGRVSTGSCSRLLPSDSDRCGAASAGAQALSALREARCLQGHG